MRMKFVWSGWIFSFFFLVNVWVHPGVLEDLLLYLCILLLVSRSLRNLYSLRDEHSSILSSLWGNIFEKPRVFRCINYSCEAGGSAANRLVISLTVAISELILSFTRVLPVFLEPPLRFGPN